MAICYPIQLIWWSCTSGKDNNLALLNVAFDFPLGCSRVLDYDNVAIDRELLSFSFQEFLKKEFSAENVYFWQACEQFQQIPASSTQKVRILLLEDQISHYVDLFCAKKIYVIHMYEIRLILIWILQNIQLLSYYEVWNIIYKMKTVNVIKTKFCVWFIIP